MPRPAFRLTHLPVLFAGTAVFVGGLIPLLGSARGAMLEYGYPERVADIPETWSVFISGNGRGTALGAVLLSLYARGRLAECDLALGILSTWLGFIDFWIDDVGAIRGLNPGPLASNASGCDPKRESYH
ncbi:hypothetical protein B0T11DRAFT_301226 [Plectosphaerella cucumerina]|uniref:Uncharacterized protein n=1 Tax=Plectosphaerella cucumerina TaxID=40658 RepID=A0A8K0TC11_9PEZI|nr:hypothetical protein B0T11DRAFT_301226 [Plectosphaerella cucumerina]